ncbi:MAG: DsbA family protein [Pseudomonadota bacterium]
MSDVTEQKGIASSTPSPLKRWFLSKLMTKVISEKSMNKHRAKREAKRVKEKRSHLVEYFHQVDDGYSHLVLQVLSKLKAQYDIKLQVHLVPALRDANFPEPDLWHKMSLSDARLIAPYYVLSAPQAKSLPSAAHTALASGILCNLSDDDFAEFGPTVSEALWKGDQKALAKLAETHGTVTQAQLDHRITECAARRAKLKHYTGGMFWYEGEWYWGIDRLYHLEERLISLGVKRLGAPNLIAPRPEIAKRYPQGAQEMTLEYYPSLRSPYTAVSWNPTLQLVRNSGVNFVMRPVLPMVMRGVPATLKKAFYVFKDAAREARALGDDDYGQFFDPIGEPIKQGYSLYVWAEAQGKGIAFFGSFLKAAFRRGIDTTKPEGLQKVVEFAGLNWKEAKEHLNDDSWHDILEENRLAMYRFGSWGVPSYRLLDKNGKEVLGVWGQDRLWLVAKKIEELSK